MALRLLLPLFLATLCACDGWHCDDTTCADGCCTADGICIVSDGSSESGQSCGTGGNACVECPGGTACVQGQCVCDASACPGCCDASGVCQAGDNTLSCGSNGAQCTRCSGDTQCTNGSCNAPPPCGYDNCSGCCLNNVCQPGDSGGACGTGGQECFTCADGYTCGGSTCY
jgi:hypothetical protein